jgi:hypothetical protein
MPWIFGVNENRSNKKRRCGEARISRNLSQKFPQFLKVFLRCLKMASRSGREFMIVKYTMTKSAAIFTLKRVFQILEGKPILGRYPYSPFSCIVSVRSILSYSAVA